MKPNRKYGQPDGLVVRMADWLRRVKHDGALPWVGLGICKDLEAIVRLLSLEEFADWLRLQEDGDLARWAEPVRAASEERQALVDMISDNLPEAGPSYEHDVEAAGAFMRDVRGVLVETGALTADDTETDVPALLRALLS